MTKSVDEFFALHSACLRSSDPTLLKLARAMIDTVLTGGSLEWNATGVCGRWRIEGRAVLRRRAAGNAAMTGNSSSHARSLRADLLRYSVSTEYARDRRPGGVPAAKDANLFAMLSASKGRVPSLRTLRRRLKNAA
jgi:hypothetical protein